MRIGNLPLLFRVHHQCQPLTEPSAISEQQG